MSKMKFIIQYISAQRLLRSSKVKIPRPHCVEFVLLVSASASSSVFLLLIHIPYSNLHIFTPQIGQILECSTCERLVPPGHATPQPDIWMHAVQTGRVLLLQGPALAHCTITPAPLSVPPSPRLPPAAVAGAQVSGVVIAASQSVLVVSTSASDRHTIWFPAPSANPVWSLHRRATKLRVQLRGLLPLLPCTQETTQAHDAWHTHAMSSWRITQHTGPQAVRWWAMAPPASDVAPDLCAYHAVTLGNSSAGFSHARPCPARVQHSARSAAAAALLGCSLTSVPNARICEVSAPVLCLEQRVMLRLLACLATWLTLPRRDTEDPELLPLQAWVDLHGRCVQSLHGMTYQVYLPMLPLAGMGGCSRSYDAVWLVSRPVSAWTHHACNLLGVTMTLPSTAMQVGTGVAQSASQQLRSALRALHDQSAADQAWKRLRRAELEPISCPYQLHVAGIALPSTAAPPGVQVRLGLVLLLRASSAGQVWSAVLLGAPGAAPRLVLLCVRPSDVGVRAAGLWLPGQVLACAETMLPSGYREAPAATPTPVHMEDIGPATFWCTATAAAAFWADPAVLPFARKHMPLPPLASAGPPASQTVLLALRCTATVLDTSATCTQHGMDMYTGEACCVRLAGQADAACRYGDVLLLCRAPAPAAVLPGALYYIASASTAVCAVPDARWPEVRRFLQLLNPALPPDAGGRKLVKSTPCQVYQLHHPHAPVQIGLLRNVYLDSVMDVIIPAAATSAAAGRFPQCTMLAALQCHAKVNDGTGAVRVRAAGSLAARLLGMPVTRLQQYSQAVSALGLDKLTVTCERDTWVQGGTLVCGEDAEREHLPDSSAALALLLKRSLALLDAEHLKQAVAFEVHLRSVEQRVPQAQNAPAQLVLPSTPHELGRSGCAVLSEPALEWPCQLLGFTQPSAWRAKPAQNPLAHVRVQLRDDASTKLTQPMPTLWLLQVEAPE